MIRLGIVNVETWDFLRDLHRDLAALHRTRVFTPKRSRSPIFRERLDRHWLQQGLHTFLREHDVVFFEWASELLAWASHMPKRCGIVTRLHRYELYTWADRINWDAVDRIILVSEAKRREFVHRFPSTASRTAVIPASVSLARFAFTERAFTGALGTLCHITPRKRIYDLVLTFHELVQRVPGLTLSIAGDANPGFLDYYQAIGHLVERLGLRDRVRFDGYVAAPWEWYPRIDVFISNSYSEGLQVAPMEAMASGCYTISHQWDGAGELLPPESLYVTNEELVQRVEAYCRMPEAERARVRARMRALAAAHFDVEDINRRVNAVVLQAAGCVRGS